MRKSIFMFLAVSSLSNFEVKALSLNDARSQGLVCEGNNGLLTPVGSVSPEVQNLITSINSQRNQEYQQIQLNQPGSTLPDVMTIAAQNIIASVPSGTYIMDASGKCRPK